MGLGLDYAFGVCFWFWELSVGTWELSVGIRELSVGTRKLGEDGFCGVGLMKELMEIMDGED